jgi:hypothetical protein
MEIWVMNADGSDQHQITNLGGANFAPYFTPDGNRIIFSSNYKNPRSRDFELYLINADGSGLEQVTHHPEFDGFPMFSPDGPLVGLGLRPFIQGWRFESLYCGVEALAAARFSSMCAARLIPMSAVVTPGIERTNRIARCASDAPG